MDDRDAKVVFIDYGNKDTVPIETLLILPSHYLDKPVQVGVVTRLVKYTPLSATPPQAIHCTLNDVCSLDPKGTWSDEVGMWNDEVGMWCDEVGMWNDEVGMWSDEVGMWSDEVGMWSDEVGMWSDEVGMWSDEVVYGMMR